jgi:hypothetical protein
MAITKTDRARATDHDMMLVGLASVWSTLTNDDHRWLREKLDGENGAFAHMMAAYESRTRTVSV